MALVNYCLLDESLMGSKVLGWILRWKRRYRRSPIPDRGFRAQPGKLLDLLVAGCLVGVEAGGLGEGLDLCDVFGLDDVLKRLPGAADLLVQRC